MSQPEESGLERDYCAGQLSLRDLAEIHGISEGAIRKRAKKHGWVRKGKGGTQKGTQVRKSGTQKSKVRTRGRSAKSGSIQEGDEAPEPKTKPIRGKRTDPPVNPFGANNRAALKHGGYARRMLLPDDVIEDAEAMGLEDELRRVQASNLIAAANIGRWGEALRDEESEERKKILRENIRGAEQAMDRNTARIESILRTFSQLAVSEAMLPKIEADTDFRRAATDKTRLECEKLGKELADDDDNDTPKPVVININVVDARRDDDSADA
ncbi:TPA: hypothetical protein ACXJQO_002862 [Serratia marcescens]